MEKIVDPILSWVIDEVGKYLVEIPKKEKQRLAEMCSEMERLAELLSEMEVSFLEGKVPYEAGNRFELLMNNPSKTLRQTMSKKGGVRELFEKQLQKLTYRMREMDWMIDGREREIFCEGWRHEVPGWRGHNHLKELIAEMSRLEGRLREYAFILKRIS